LTPRWSARWSRVRRVEFNSLLHGWIANTGDIRPGDGFGENPPPGRHPRRDYRSDWQPWFERYVYGTETPEVKE
jgi:hypothetical protein